VPSVSIGVNAIENVVTSFKLAISDFIVISSGIISTSISASFANDIGVVGNLPGYFTTIGLGLN
jgi:hypothetical protein